MAKKTKGTFKVLVVVAIVAAVVGAYFMSQSQMFQGFLNLGQLQSNEPISVENYINKNKYQVVYPSIANLEYNYNNQKLLDIDFSSIDDGIMNGIKIKALGTADPEDFIKEFKIKIGNNLVPFTSTYNVYTKEYTFNFNNRMKVVDLSITFDSFSNGSQIGKTLGFDVVSILNVKYIKLQNTNIPLRTITQPLRRLN